MRKINQLHWLDENEAVRNFMYKYGLRGDETITGGLILGYSEAGEPIWEPLERKGHIADTSLRSEVGLFRVCHTAS